MLRAKRLSTLSELASEPCELAIVSQNPTDKWYALDTNLKVTLCLIDCAEERSDSARLFLEGFLTVGIFGQKWRKQRAKLRKRGLLVCPRLRNFARCLRHFGQKCRRQGVDHFGAKIVPKLAVKFWPKMIKNRLPSRVLAHFWPKFCVDQFWPILTLKITKSRRQATKMTKISHQNFDGQVPSKWSKMVNFGLILGQNGL